MARVGSCRADTDPVFMEMALCAVLWTAFPGERNGEMSDPTPNGPPYGYRHFVLALAIGIIIGTVVPLILEYFGLIDFVKNWP